MPNISIATKELFESSHLRISSEIDKSQNNFLDALTNENQKFSEFISFLCENLPKNTQNKLKLSGTGSTLFIENPNDDEIQLIMGKIDKNFRVFQVKGLEYYH